MYFDFPSSDRGSKSSLNAEYVVIRNGDNVSHSVSGWTVRDKAGHVYKFGNLRLGAGGWPSFTPARAPPTPPVPVRTSTGVGAGMSGTTPGTKVILRRADGSLKDTCSFGSAGSVKYC